MLDYSIFFKKVCLIQNIKVILGGSIPTNKLNKLFIDFHKIIQEFDDFHFQEFKAFFKAIQLNLLYLFFKLDFLRNLIIFYVENLFDNH